MVTSSFNRSSLTIDPTVALTQIVTTNIYYEGDGTVKSRSITTNTYDAQGLLLSSISERDNSVDGIIDERHSTTNTYDAQGLLLSSISERDNSVDGISYRDSIINTYNDRGLLLSTVSERDDDGEDYPFYERESTINTYNDEGLLLSSLSEREWEPDYGLSRRESTTKIYNDEGLLLSTFYEIDWGADGIIDERHSTTNTYDAQGLLLSSFEEQDNNADDIIDERHSTTNTYDAQGLLLSSLSEYDSDVDDDITDERHSITNIYNDEGLLLFSLSEDDYDAADNGLYVRESTTNTYDPQGLLLSTVTLNEEDSNADGIIDYRAETLYEFNYASTVVNSQRLVSTDGEVWEIQGSGAETAHMQFTFHSSEAKFVNEVGLFLVDEENRVNGIAPNDPRYTQEALAQGITIFSCLPDEEMLTGLNFSRLLSAIPGARVAFYLVSDSTTDTLLGETTGTANVFFSIQEANPDGVDHLRVSESNDQLILKWEDLWAGGDQDFNDLVMGVELVKEPLSLQQLTASYQGFPEGEMLDLRELAGQQVQANLVVKREADFDNFFGLYQVENEQGTVRDPLSGQLLNPEDVGYIQAALLNSQEHGFSFEGRDASWQTSLNGGFLFAPFLIADGSPELILDDDPNNDRSVYFSYIGANPERVDHVRLLGDNTFGFEDLFGGGDLDYNDIVFQVNCQIVSVTDTADELNNSPKSDR